MEKSYNTGSVQWVQQIFFQSLYIVTDQLLLVSTAEAKCCLNIVCVCVCVDRPGIRLCFSNVSTET